MCDSDTGWSIIETIVPWHLPSIKTNAYIPLWDITEKSVRSQVLTIKNRSNYVMSVELARFPASCQVKQISQQPVRAFTRYGDDLASLSRRWLGFSPILASSCLAAAGVSHPSSTRQRWRFSFLVPPLSSVSLLLRRGDADVGRPIRGDALGSLGDLLVRT